MKTIDCFTFFSESELNLLDIRFNILAPYVDYFVIVEATFTHSGKEKELVFEKYKDHFKQFESKIIYHVVDSKNGNETSWALEHYQRNCIATALESLNLNDNDIILVSDCDEIPNPDYFIAFKYLDQYPALAFNMRMFYCWLNMECINYGLHKQGSNTWEFLNTRAVKYELFKTMSVDEIRRYNDCGILNSAGHHFSFMNINSVPNKLRSFAHTEHDTIENNNIEILKGRLKGGWDLLHRYYRFEVVEIDQTFPKYIRDNKEKFKHLILNSRNEIK